MEVGGLEDRLPRLDLGNSVLVHPQVSHSRFPMDGAMVGAVKREPKPQVHQEALNGVSGQETLFHWIPFPLANHSG